MIGFCHDSWFARNWVAHHPETVFCTDYKSEKPIKILEAAFQCFAQCAALLHFPRQIGCPDLSIVFGFDMDAFAAQFAAQAIVIGQRSVVDQTLVRSGRERVRTHRGDGRFRCHTGVANTMRARHLVDIKPGGDIAGQPDLFIDFNCIAGTHHPQFGAQRAQGGTGGFDAVSGNVENRMGVFTIEADICANCSPEIGAQRGEIFCLVIRLNGQFCPGFDLVAIDCNASTIGASIGHRNKHLC